MASRRRSTAPAPAAVEPVEAPQGAHFTECPPDYGRDEAFQRMYAATAKTDEAWDEFRAGWLDLSESDYQARRAAEGDA